MSTPEPPLTRVKTEALIARMEAMPSHPSVAMRVLWLTDDHRTTIDGLARATELDPILAAQLMRIANSAYYSLRTPVTNVPRAIMVLGFSTVRALATASVSGLRSSKHPIPVQFWEHAAAVANACQLIGGRYDVPSSDAFALGLLHDLGSGLLFMADQDAWRTVEEQVDGGGSLEKRLFGITHQEIGARILEAWRFPRDFVEAVSRHHHRLETREQAYTRCLIASELIAEVALGHVTGVRAESHRTLLIADGFVREQLERVIERVSFEYGSLSEVLAETDDS
jgi:putative nucleotidyltransferase with HDIG domain